MRLGSDGKGDIRATSVAKHEQAPHASGEAGGACASRASSAVARLDSDDRMITPMWDDLAPRLEGEIVVLEPLRRDHLDQLFEVARPVEIWEFWPFNPASDRRRFEEWLDDVRRTVASGTEARFVTLDAHTRHPI